MILRDPWQRSNRRVDSLNRVLIFVDSDKGHESSSRIGKRDRYRTGIQSLSARLKLSAVTGIGSVVALGVVAMVFSFLCFRLENLFIYFCFSTAGGVHEPSMTAVFGQYVRR